MEIEIVSKETIKPLSSTPAELRHFDICLFDRHAPNIYLLFLYFYNNGSSGGPTLLKESLSKTLTFYYPFAGRLGDNGDFVDCNDMGATFLVAKLPRYRMSEVMNTSDLQRDEILKFICCDDMDGKDPRFNPLLSVQLTQFECGGEAISVFLSHKLADTATFVNFMNDWASITRTSGGNRLSLSVFPQFNAASLFPSDDLPKEQGFEPIRRDENIVSKRFVFEASKIAALKALVSSKKVENPSRVQVVSSLIYKAAISTSTSIAVASTCLLQVIELRSRVVLPLPSTLTGNIVSFFIASSTTSKQRETNTIELSNLVGDMKRNMDEFCNKYPKKYKVEEWDSLYKLHMKESMEKMSNPSDLIVYACSSWCRFPFYDADFGWGKPVWITAPVIWKKNVIILIDAKDGEGIEALVSLEREEMAVFERNEELLSFCELKI